MEKGLTQEIKKRVESIEGMDIVDAVKLRYITELRSYRWLCSHWKINNRTVRRILMSCNITPRHGSEAVKTQWIDNIGRRKNAGERLARMNHELASKGLHVRQGKTKTNSQLIRNIAEKLQKSSSFLRPEARAKAVEHSKFTRLIHPERMSAIRASLSECESIIADYLTDKGLPFESRKLIGKYVVDFFIPSLQLVIDCQGRNRFPLSFERHKCISQDDNHVVYCVNQQVKRGVNSRLDDYISRLEQLRLNPSGRCAKTVILGACGDKPFAEETDNFIVNRLGMHADYVTELSTASDD